MSNKQSVESKEDPQLHQDMLDLMQSSKRRGKPPMLPQGSRERLQPYYEMVIAYEAGQRQPESVLSMSHTRVLHEGMGLTDEDNGAFRDRMQTKPRPMLKIDTLRSHFSLCIEHGLNAVSDQELARMILQPRVHCELHILLDVLMKLRTFRDRWDKFLYRERLVFMLGKHLMYEINKTCDTPIHPSWDEAVLRADKLTLPPRMAEVIANRMSDARRKIFLSCTPKVPYWNTDFHRQDRDLRNEEARAFLDLIFEKDSKEGEENDETDDE